MEPISEAEESILKSVRRDSKDKRNIVFKILENMKNNPDRGSNATGQACERCPPLIREDFIDFLIEELEKEEVAKYEGYEPTTKEYLFFI